MDAVAGVIFMGNLRGHVLSNLVLLVWWTLAGAAGFAVGGLVEVAVGRPNGLMVVMYITVGGSATGLLQWLVLRQRVSGAGLWMAASFGGGIAAGLVGVAVGVLAGLGAGVVLGLSAAIEVGTDAGGVAVAVSFGTVVGVLQWLVIQRQVPRSYWWVLASSVGWVLGGLTAGVTEGVAGWAVLGAVYGAVTGCVLLGLLAWRRAAA